MTFPREEDRARLNRYSHADLLYQAKHYEAFSIKATKDFTPQYQQLRYVVGNFAGLASRVLADMLFGDNLTIDVEDKNNQIWVEGLVEQNQLLTQLYESALGNSRRGDAMFKLRIGPRHPRDPKPSIIAEEFSPALYFPEMDRSSTRYTPKAEVIATVFKQGEKHYLHKEIHTPGFINNEVYEYKKAEQKIGGSVSPAAFGFVPEQTTGVNRSLVFHIPNFRDSTGYFGTSDYQDLETLFFALNNRLTKTDNILDKHSDPILAVPPGVLDEEGKVKREALSMVEVDNEVAGFNKPEYIVWNANLDSAFKQIDKLVELLYLFAEVSPASTSANEKSQGQAESGRALKFRLLSTIRKRGRKVRYYDQGIKDLLFTAQELAIAHSIDIDGKKISTPERPTLDWGDGVINDDVEAVEIETKRVEAGLTSRAQSIARLDGVTPDESKKRVAEIDAEDSPRLPDLDNPAGGAQTGDNQAEGA